MAHVMNLTRHPIDALSLLNMMLERWEHDQSETIVLLTEIGDGAALVNRLRVRMSIVRKSIKEDGERLHIFRLNTHVLPWTELDNTKYDGIICTKTRTAKFQMMEIFDQHLKGEKS